MIEAGYPPGVFSLVHGDKEAALALVDHPDVAAVGFVGSTAAARAVYTRATALGKRALCLGGAKNHILVVPDADEAITVRGVVDSFTGCAGQRCMAASVLLAVGAGRARWSSKIVGARGRHRSSAPGMGAHHRSGRPRPPASPPSIAPRRKGPRCVLDGRRARAAGRLRGRQLAGAHHHRPRPPRHGVRARASCSARC